MLFAGDMLIVFEKFLGAGFRFHIYQRRLIYHGCVLDVWMHR